MSTILDPFKKLFAPLITPLAPKTTTTAPKSPYLGPVSPNMTIAPKPAPTTTFLAPVKPQITSTAPAPTPTVTKTPIVPKTPTTVKPPDDPSNKYNTATGELNTKYTGYQAPTSRDTSTAPKKPAVPVLTESEKAIKNAENLYSKSLQLSPDELSTQGDLDRLVEATQKGYTATKHQAIPMGYITGQLQAIEERALNLAQPLEQKLARLQAARTASLNSSKFALERADKQLELETEQNKPIEVGGSLLKLNKETGDYDTVFKGSTSKPASVQEYEYAKENGFNGTFEEYQDADANRKRIAAGAGGLTTAQQSAAFKLSDDYRAESKDFFTQKAAYNRILSSAQDPSAAGDLALIFNYMKVLDPGSTVREGEFATAQNSGSIPEIIYAKYNKVQSGERLAPEQRADFLDRATKLFTGAQQAQKQIDDTYTERANRYGVPLDLILSNTSANNQPAVTLESFYRDNPDKRPNIDKLIEENPTLSDDDILQIIGFKSVGGDTNRATSLEDAKERIARNESEGSGGYQALGPVVTSGQYKGERALGKYQVMPGNLPDWSREAIGRVVSSQEFINSPELQEKIVSDRLAKIYKQYGNWDDVASVWFTGEPLATGADKKDVLGTSGREYVRKFNA